MPLITLEGLDRSGKSTLAGSLERELGARAACHFLREPGGTALGERVRSLLKGEIEGVTIGALAELTLFNAARAQLLEEQVRPALAAGEIVVLDRFTDSSVAYQGWGRRLGPQFVSEACAAATGGLVPDITLMLVVSSAERARRLGQLAAEDRIEQAGDGFFERVREANAAIAAAEPGRVVCLDADQPPAQVLADALAALSARAIIA